jgi:hypothetical protein
VSNDARSMQVSIVIPVFPVATRPAQ